MAKVVFGTTLDFSESRCLGYQYLVFYSRQDLENYCEEPLSIQTEGRVEVRQSHQQILFEHWCHVLM